MFTSRIDMFQMCALFSVPAEAKCAARMPSMETVSKADGLRAGFHAVTQL